MGKFIAVIKTLPEDLTFPGFEGGASYKFSAELKYGNGRFLGVRDIIIMCKPSYLDKIVPDTECVLFLSLKDKEFLLEGIQFNEDVSPSA